MAPIIVLVVLCVLIVLFILYKRPKKKIILPGNYKQLLSDHVSYYRRLDEKKKVTFEEKIKGFLGYVRIDGIDTTVDDLDKLLVASSAIIPVFGFEKWTYFNLKNVLLYPASFNKDEFLASGYEKNTLGMIGNGPMQRVMILSKPALHFGYQTESTKENTGIHEFVHLLDKEDGDVDGLPEALMKKKYVVPWLNMISENMIAMTEGRSDINVYGLTNKAEFFAVVSEYFFSRPDLFKEKHPDLYNLMTEIFHQKPPVSTQE